MSVTENFAIVCAPLLIGAFEKGGWRFQVGDPTVVGWTIVVAYLLAMSACGWVWLNECRSCSQGNASDTWFWGALTLLLLSLGINKQLDLHTLITEFGRYVARLEGWYQHRRFYQAVFVVAAGIGGLVLLGFAGWLIRKHWKRDITAFAGAVLLCVFVLSRAAAFHHVRLGMLGDFAGWKLHETLELSSIGIVTLGALLALNDVGQESTTLTDGSQADDPQS